MAKKQKKSTFRKQMARSMAELQSTMMHGESPNRSGRLKARKAEVGNGELVREGVSGLTAKKRDLSGFVGSWVEDSAFDRAVAEFRQVERAPQTKARRR